MNNLSMSLKKFVSNKNTVTILGVVLCLIILYVGYNRQISRQLETIELPYAIDTIQPRTAITADMIGWMEVPVKFLNESEYYRTEEDLIGKYSNYNTLIAKGSIFYKDLITEEGALPNSAFKNIKANETPINYRVDMDTTYANSMMPDDYINIYFKGQVNEETIMFGKFISNIKILAIKDSEGRHVFENTTEARVPSYMLFALPEDFHLLFRKALYLENSAGVEISLVPSTGEINEGTNNEVNEEIKNYIEEKTKDVDLKTILSETANRVGSDLNTKNPGGNTNQ